MPHHQYKLCTEVTPECPVSATTYGYYPNLPADAFYVGLFGLLLILQLIFGTFRRTWTFMLALGLGTFGECIGYGGRVMMHYNPWSQAGFKIQICCLVLAPSFLAAGVYLTLKHLILYYGPEYSRFKPKFYPWIFIGCDFASIVLQAIGGGVAAAAGDSGLNKGLLNAGDGLIVAGIAAQVATMLACAIVVLDWYMRYQKGKAIRPISPEEAASAEHEKQGVAGESMSKTTMKLRIFICGFMAAFSCILIRCIYRLPEMGKGWGNRVMREETEFLIFDGAMVAIACILMTVFHPGYWFAPMRFTKKKNRNHETVASEAVIQKD